MIRFHNTLSRKLEDFVPIVAGKAGMYNCGPTVYSSQHIGNYRAYGFTDLLRRFLDLRGFEVTQVMNITDVGHLRDEVHDAGEDKLEAAARKAKVDPQQLAAMYTQEFFDGLDLLRVRRAHHYPRATQHVPQMIEIIQGLLDKGIAYRVGDEVYYDVSRFPGYGALSGNRGDELEAGASERVADEVMAKKRHPRDFALWKSDPHHIQQWDAPWGRGFPGWHIECSAMSRTYLGDTFDIHTGGENNIFPHHECEIAQSEGFTGKRFVNVWLHAAHLNLEGEKMAKSEGNVLYPKDLVAQGESPVAIRWYLQSVHYRQPMNFTREALKAASSGVERLLNFHDTLKHRADKGPDGVAAVKVVESLDEARARYVEALDQDLNVAEANAVLFDLMRSLNAMDLTRGDAAATLGFLTDVDQVLGILPVAEESLEAEVERKIQEREAARRRKDFKASDRIRDELLAKGIVLMDSPDGVRWRRK